MESQQGRASIRYRLIKWEGFVGFCFAPTTEGRWFTQSPRRRGQAELVTEDVLVRFSLEGHPVWTVERLRTACRSGQPFGSMTPIIPSTPLDDIYSKKTSRGECSIAALFPLLRRQDQLVRISSATMVPFADRQSAHRVQPVDRQEPAEPVALRSDEGVEDRRSWGG